MTTAHAFALLVLLLPACDGAPAATIDGHATLKGLQDSSGITIAFDCCHGITDNATTSADGSYQLTAASTYLVTLQASAPSTLEGMQSVNVYVDGDEVTAPPIIFTPLGGLRGRVLVAGAPASGVEVGIEGLTVSAFTDAMGGYAFSGVPAGSYTLVASTSGHPTTELAAQDVVYNSTKTAADLSIP